MTGFRRSALVLYSVLASRSKYLLAVAKDPCEGGSCPNGTPGVHDSGGDVKEEQCDLWLGPSPIKEHEEHGFGLGMFTGKDIPAGSSLDANILIPIVDWSDEQHPPLREYVWDGENMPEYSLQSREGMFYFVPGAAAFASCTSQNYNLEFRWEAKNVPEDSVGVHRSTHPTAGSFSYRRLERTFTAVRNIVAGEELTIDCSDANYDAGSYYLSRFHSNDKAVVCLDKVFVDHSTVDGAGRGLFAKKDITKGSIITSTPVVPIHRDEMTIKACRSCDVDLDDNSNMGERMHQEGQKQLLLNYCYSHPDSDLLLLPYGNYVNYINHPSVSETANAEMQWHSANFYSNDKLPLRQQHHHPELLKESANRVSKVHGKGLMIDYIATRNIRKGEEIFMDYGPEWTQAWKAHVEVWKKKTSATETKEANNMYITAEDYNRKESASIIRTEAEQKNDPYPINLQTACHFSSEDEDELNGSNTIFESWADQKTHKCLLPCIIEHRYQKDKKILYRAKILHVSDSPDVSLDCQLTPGFNYIYSDIPRHGINFINRPYNEEETNPKYISAAEYGRTENISIIRTATEQLKDPYPRTIQTACRFSSEDEDPDPELYQEDTVYESWNFQEFHDCILPCVILDRYQGPNQETLYKAKSLHVFDNPDIPYDCQLTPGYVYVYSDIPREGIELIDRPYTADTYLHDAFRQEIGVPKGLYPESWMRKKVRRREGPSKDFGDDTFKRKQQRKPLVQKMGRTTEEVRKAAA